MNGYDPAERAALVERVGPAEYERLFREHRERSVVEVANGHAIRLVGSRFGPLYEVGSTERAFSTLQEARAFAVKEAIPS